MIGYQLASLNLLFFFFHKKAAKRLIEDVLILFQGYFGHSLGFFLTIEV
jgi:hypothetical protein